MVYVYVGEVELENLPLKRDALRHLGLPIQVRAGFIGKVKLQIPIPQIRSAAWVIIIEQLCLVTGPVKLTEVCECEFLVLF
jgi:vacuolar protein sorting-associated protein 13D